MASRTTPVVPTILKQMIERSVAAGERRWAHALASTRPLVQSPRDLWTGTGDAVRVRVAWEHASVAYEMTLTRLCEWLSADPAHALPSYLELLVQGPAGEPFMVEAAAYAESLQEEIGGIALPQPMRLGILVHAWDLRGISAALFETAHTSGTPSGFADPVEMGIALGRALAKTSIPGLEGRAERAVAVLLGHQPRSLAELGGAVARHAAGAVAEYFADGRAEADGGPPVQQFEASLAHRGGLTRLGGTPDQVDHQAERRRWARLNEVVVRALEEEAYGHGIHSPRGRRRIVPLPPIDDESVLRIDLPDLSRVEAEVIEREAAADRDAQLDALRGRLRPDERALLDARLLEPDESLPEVAAHHQWDPADVAATWRRVLRQARALSDH